MQCRKCGASMPEGSKFCQSCGENLVADQANSAEKEQTAQSGTYYNQQTYQAPPEQRPFPTAGKSRAVICYLLGTVGIIIALLASDRDDAYTRYHANQALCVTLFVLLALVPIIGWIWGIFIVICWIIGLSRAAGGTCAPLPLIGNIRIIPL